MATSLLFAGQKRPHNVERSSRVVCMYNKSTHSAEREVRAPPRNPSAQLSSSRRGYVYTYTGATFGDMSRSVRFLRSFAFCCAYPLYGAL